MRVETLPTLDVGQYDPFSDTIVIEGTRYSGELFRDGYGLSACIGQVHRVDKREDGVVTITRLHDLETVS